MASVGAGADFVMLGGMLAGHDQSGGDIIEQNGKRFKLFYGMSSSTAMEKHQGGVKDYRCMCVYGHNITLYCTLTEPLKGRLWS